jgi:hypothetical protein
MGACGAERAGDMCTRLFGVLAVTLLNVRGLSCHPEKSWQFQVLHGPDRGGWRQLHKVAWQYILGCAEQITGHAVRQSAWCLLLQLFVAAWRPLLVHGRPLWPSVGFPAAQSQAREVYTHIYVQGATEQQQCFAAYVWFECGGVAQLDEQVAGFLPVLPKGAWVSFWKHARQRVHGAGLCAFCFSRLCVAIRR